MPIADGWSGVGWFISPGRGGAPATKLLDWMYQNIWTDKKVRLDVLAHNEEAIAFYKAYGFRVGCLRMEK